MTSNYLVICEFALYPCIREKNSEASLSARRNFWLGVLDVNCLHLLHVKIQRFYIQAPNGGAAMKKKQPIQCFPISVVIPMVFLPILVSSSLFLFTQYLPCFVRSAYLLNCLISHERWGFHCRGTNCIYLPADPPIDVKGEIPVKGTLHDGRRNVHTLHILCGHSGETSECVI
jgi:hypothetical protein